MRKNLVKELRLFGKDDYYHNLKEKLIPFTTSRLAPFIAFTLILISISRFNYPELANFSYLTALYSLPVILLSMPLAMIGNLVSNKKNDIVHGVSAFKSGLPLCIFLTLAGFIVSLVIHLFFLHSTNHNFVLASGIYIFCVPFLILNTYLFFFIESSINSKVMANIKIYTALLCTIGIVVTALNVQLLLTWHVFFVFFIFEIVLFLCYLNVIRKHLKDCYLDLNKKSIYKYTKNILAMGLPVSLGMAGQKLVYFLMALRLLKVDELYVSDLSVLMSVLGFIALPLGAFTQIHSLYVSNGDYSNQLHAFKKGIVAFLFLIIFVSIIFLLLNTKIIEIFGSTHINDQHGYIKSLTIFFLSTSLMSLCMAHLRALKDTFIPQAMANIILLLFYIPAIWFQSDSASTVPIFLNYQSAFLFFISFLLVLRIHRKRMATCENEVLP